MSDKVYIAIVGETSVDGECDKTEMVTEGEYVFRAGNHMLRYKERLAEDGEECSTIIKCDGKKVTMTRTGAANTQMIFENGKRHMSLYETPLGSFSVNILTDSVNVDVGETGGEIKINYALDINSSMRTQNRLQLNIRRTPQNFGA